MFLIRPLSILIFLMIPLIPAAAKGPTNVSIRLADDLQAGTYSGHLYVIFADQRDDRDPLTQISAGKKVQIVKHPVKDWNGVAPLMLPSDAEAYPAKLNNIKAGSYKIQTFLVCASTIGACEAGGLLSTPKIIKVSLMNGTNIKLLLDHSGPVPDKIAPSGK